MWTVDIDVGGTLTDGIFSRGDKVVCVKVDSTPHDLTVCLFDCLAQAASKLGYADTEQFLEEVELIRWSTTITSNVLAEGHGPRIGLLVSKGHEQDLYGSERSVVLNRLLAESDVIGVNGTAGETQIMTAARALLERGVRRICVSLKGDGRYHEREIAIKRIIDQQYPDHFLGSVPVLAGSDIAQGADDRTRTYCALINAYTHGALAATLFKAEDELRENYRYPGAFLVSHVNGGVAGIGKTKAIDTIESGPILGMHASAHLAKIYGLNGVIALDVGGTTAKVGVLRKGEPIYRKPSDFLGIPVGISLPYLRSIALGGGSVVKPSGNRATPGVQLGPESMGSYPGPACYGLGGDQATLTDAFVTAGLISPEYFLGGTKPIDSKLARTTIEEVVAKTLGVAVEEACLLIIDRAFQMVGELIADCARDLGEDLSQHTLFAYGGNGGLFACGVAEKIGLQRVQTFALGPVFSAFGSSVADISHVYERAAPELRITEENVCRIRAVVEEMKTESVQDLLGEGIRPEGVSYSLEFEVSTDGRASIAVPCPEPVLHTAKDLQAALAAGGGNPGQICLQLIRLRSRKAITKPHLMEPPLQSRELSQARTGARAISWGSSRKEAQVYRWESLEGGHCVAGPAVLESVNTTYFVPEHWAMTIDRYGNGGLRRASEDRPAVHGK